MAYRRQVLLFVAGAQAFHALVHAYLSATKAEIDHPAERLGIAVTPRFHAIAAAINGAIALGLGAVAVRSPRPEARDLISAADRTAGLSLRRR